VGSALALGVAWTLVNTLGTQLKADMQAVRDQDALAREQFKLQAVLAETEIKRAQLNNHIIEGDDGAVELLSLVDQIATDLDINLETKRLEVVENETSDFDTLEVAFSISGQERSVMKMLQLLELLPYRSEVANLSAARTLVIETGRLETKSEVLLHASITKDK
ncbi:MAG: hypothetical protein AAFO91_12140, partial [Bacteroidota bacterium]